MEAGQPLRKPPAYRAQTEPSPSPPLPRRPAPPPSYYYPKKKSRLGICCRSCCCLCCILLFILILIAITGGIFYFWFQPKLPVFRFRPIEIDHFNITKPPAAGQNPRLDSDLVIRVEVGNPNSKLQIYLGKTTVSLTADQATNLGSATVPGFKQPTNNVTLLKFEARVANKEIDATVAAPLAIRVKNKGVVLSAAVKTKVGIGAGKLKLGMLPVSVNCGGLSLKQLNDGKSSPKCSFTTLRWITIH